MAKDDLVQLKGEVVDLEAGGIYKVELLDEKGEKKSGKVIKAKICGRMRKFNIRVIVGDRVTVGVSPYDTSHGFITYRE